MSNKKSDIPATEARTQSTIPGPLPKGASRPSLVAALQLSEVRASLATMLLFMSIVPLLLYAPLVVTLAVIAASYVFIRKVANGFVWAPLGKIFGIPPVVGGDHEPIKWARALCEKPADDKFPLKGKIAVITGGNRGIGYETAKCLASLGCGIIIASRSPSQNAIDEMKKEISKECSEPRIEWVQMDLMDPASIESFARRAAPAATLLSKGLDGASTPFTEQTLRIDFLINNAGGMPSLSKPEPKAPGARDVIVESNHIGPMKLTEKLLPNLSLGGPRKGTTGRVVMLGSITQAATELLLSSKPGETVRDALVESSSDTHTKTPLVIYYLAKLCNLLFAEYLATELKNTDVTCVHPGWVQTRLSTSVPESPIIKIASVFVGKEVWAGARAVVYGTLAPYDPVTRKSVHHGKFIADCRDASAVRLQFSQRKAEINNMMAWSRSSSTSLASTRSFASQVIERVAAPQRLSYTSSSSYQDTTIPTGNGLPDTRITYTVLSDTALPEPREISNKTLTPPATLSMTPVSTTPSSSVQRTRTLQSAPQATRLLSTTTSTTSVAGTGYTYDPETKTYIASEYSSSSLVPRRSDGDVDASSLSALLHKTSSTTSALSVTHPSSMTTKAASFREPIDASEYSGSRSNSESSQLPSSSQAYTRSHPYTTTTTSYPAASTLSLASSSSYPTSSVLSSTGSTMKVTQSISPAETYVPSRGTHKLPDMDSSPSFSLLRDDAVTTTTTTTYPSSRYTSSSEVTTLPATASRVLSSTFSAQESTTYSLPSSKSAPSATTYERLSSAPIEGVCEL